jgi:hypothetical protein
VKFAERSSRGELPCVVIRRLILKLLSRPSGLKTHMNTHNNARRKLNPLLSFFAFSPSFFFLSRQHMLAAFLVAHERLVYARMPNVTYVLMASYHPLRSPTLLQVRQPTSSDLVHQW